MTSIVGFRHQKFLKQSCLKDDPMRDENIVDSYCLGQSGGGSESLFNDGYSVLLVVFGHHKFFSDHRLQLFDGLVLHSELFVV